MNIEERIKAMIDVHEKWKIRNWRLHGWFVLVSIILTLVIPSLIGLSATLTLPLNLNALIIILSGLAIIFQIADLVMKFGDRYRYHNARYKEYLILDLQRATNQLDDLEAAKRFEQILLRSPDEPA
jgi:hypothetical protein